MSGDPWTESLRRCCRIVSRVAGVRPCAEAPCEGCQDIAARLELDGWTDDQVEACADRRRRAGEAPCWLGDQEQPCEDCVALAAVRARHSEEERSRESA